jgi:hypothetical protein
MLKAVEDGVLDSKVLSRHNVAAPAAAEDGAKGAAGTAERTDRGKVLHTTFDFDMSHVWWQMLCANKRATRLVLWRRQQQQQLPVEVHKP